MYFDQKIQFSTHIFKFLVVQVLNFIIVTNLG